MTSFIPVLQFDYRNNDPITAVVSKMVSDNIELLKIVPALQAELDETQINNDLENKQIEQLQGDILQSESQIIDLEREVSNAKETVREMIEEKELTKEDFLTRANLLFSTATSVIEECSKFVNLIGHPKSCDIGCQTQVNEDEEYSSILDLQAEIGDWNTVVKLAKKRRHTHNIQVVTDESAMTKSERSYIKTSPQKYADSRCMKDFDAEKEIREKPIWMSELVYRYSTSFLPFDKTVKCAGCMKQFRARVARGTLFPELDCVIHCVEECVKFKQTGGILSCYKCGLKFINETEYDLHQFASHEESPGKPSWMSSKIYAESYLKFKPNTILPCPGCSLEFEASKKGRQTTPSFYLYIHSVQNCIDCEFGGLLRTCAKCGQQFMRDYGFNAHQRNNCDAKFNMKC